MTSIYFHEDDFCQIEILPVENLAFCLKQAGRITEFADEHREGVGFSHMYMREDASASLRSKKILAADLKNLLMGILPEFDEIYMGYGRYRETCEFTNAFGQNENVVLFYEQEAEFVKNIWLKLEVGNSADIESAMGIFGVLSQMGEFLIADWEWGFVEVLKNVGSVMDYLEELMRAFNSR